MARIRVKMRVVRLRVSVKVRVRVNPHGKPPSKSIKKASSELKNCLTYVWHVVIDIKNCCLELEILFAFNNLHAFNSNL